MQLLCSTLFRECQTLKLCKYNVLLEYKFEFFLLGLSILNRWSMTISLSLRKIFALKISSFHSSLVLSLKNIVHLVPAFCLLHPPPHLEVHLLLHPSIAIQSKASIQSQFSASKMSKILKHLNEKKCIGLRISD